MTRWLNVLCARWRAILHRDAMERELEAELADHLASEAEELEARGLPHRKAETHAHATMGHRTLIEEECRDARGVSWWENLEQDTTFALRLLAKRKTFAAMAIGTMMLGIGSTSAVFSVVDTVLLRPLPFAEPQRLFAANGIGMRGPFDVLRTRSQVADYAGYQGVRAFNLLPDDRSLPERIKGSEVSANFFDVLGIAPLIGRVFLKDEDRPGRSPVAVLTHSFWMQRYGGRTGVIGERIVLDEVPYEIVGVMPAGVQFPAPEAQLWIPMRLDPRNVGEYWGSGGTMMIARLRPGATLHAARHELQSETPRIRAMFPWRMPDAWGASVSVRDLHDDLVSGARLRSWLLLGTVALVLLIAVVNVANLMIGHTTARAHEIALRTSLGATAGRIARQLLTESLVLAATGGLFGVLLGYAQLAALRSLLPADTPRLAEVTMDTRMLAFTLTISLVCGILIGLWPAWRATHQQTLVTSRMGRVMRSDALLVTLEAAFATILLVGSGLLIRSLYTMLQVDVGFRVDSVVTAELSPSPSAATSMARRTALLDSVRTRLMQYPGVRNIGAMNVLPLAPRVSAFAAAIEDHPVPERQPQYVLWATAVTPEHRDVLGIRVLEGRGFTDADRAGSEPVVLISRSTARRFWPDRSPLGRRLKPVYDRQWRTIVGVVEDVKTFSMDGPPDWIHGETYLPISQFLEPKAPVWLIARVEGDPAAFEQAMAALVQEVCTTCAVSQIARMPRIVARASEAPRSTAWLVGLFAALALGLAGAGIYGVVTHAVVRRTRELGVRMALGANRGRIAVSVVALSFRSVVLGSVAGLLGAWIAAKYVQSLLFGVTPHDALSFAAGPLVLFLITIIASAAPSLRATRIDPAESLREG